MHHCLCSEASDCVALINSSLVRWSMSASFRAFSQVSHATSRLAASALSQSVLQSANNVTFSLTCQADVYRAMANASSHGW
eukprot:scaffold79523_cov20-Prasinocladus_malaysianus.AAC.1